jgi:hypothetical protein
VAKPDVCISTAPRSPPNPAAADDPDRLLFARGWKRLEVRIGVQLVDQGGEDLVGHIRHEADIILLQRVENDLVPGAFFRRHPHTPSYRPLVSQLDIIAMIVNNHLNQQGAKK